MIETVGFLELNSIAKGVEAADAILKAAQVELAFAKPVCPGKYNILFTGEVAAVKASMDAGIAVGGSFVVESRISEFFLPCIHRRGKHVTFRFIGVAERIDKIFYHTTLADMRHIAYFLNNPVSAKNQKSSKKYTDN